MSNSERYKLFDRARGIMSTTTIGATYLRSTMYLSKGNTPTQVDCIGLLLNSTSQLGTQLFV